MNASQLAQIESALQLAQAGLEWYRDTFPDAVDGSDDEADEEIAAALALVREAQAKPDDDETPAEEAMRSLACWLGVGGYNAPTVDAKLYEQKIREGVTVYSQLHGFVARDLAEAVLHMDLITPRGIRARELARQVLGIVPPAKQREAQAAEASELDEMRAYKDAAYEERNKVVAALARLFPSGVARTAIEGWSDDWHGCVYIDLPTGQVSWHFHDSQARLFAGLPQYAGKWDGHDTPEKYRRLAALSGVRAAEAPRMTAESTARPLIIRAQVRLRAWHAKYADHQPQWLPPAGDVRWLEDAQAYLNAAGMSAPDAAPTDGGRQG